MGSACLLVVGDDWRTEMNRFQSMDYADPLSPFIVAVDWLQQALERHAAATTTRIRLGNGRVVDKVDEITSEELMRYGTKAEFFKVPTPTVMPFFQWVRSQYGAELLEAGEAPDLTGRHRNGWLRVNAAGEFIELVRRDIPGGFFFHFIGTHPLFQLKPGATGWNISRADEATPVHAGLAGSARLADIDFEAMRRSLVESIGARWDAVHAVAAGATWLPFSEIRARYPAPSEACDEGIEQAASQAWFAQATLQKLLDARCTRDYTHAALDLMLLPRPDYVQRCTPRGVLGNIEVVEKGRLFQLEDETAFLSRLDGDTLLTCAAVKC